MQFLVLFGLRYQEEWKEQKKKNRSEEQTSIIKRMKELFFHAEIWNYEPCYAAISSLVYSFVCSKIFNKNKFKYKQLFQVLLGREIKKVFFLLALLFASVISITI